MTRSSIGPPVALSPRASSRGPLPELFGFQSSSARRRLFHNLRSRQQIRRHVLPGLDFSCANARAMI